MSKPNQNAEPSGSEDGAPLDLLLSEAATGVWRRFLPNSSTARFALKVGRRPDLLGRSVIGVAKELGKVAAGRSWVEPSPSDRRFSADAWSGNPALRAVLRAYLVTADAAQRVVDETDLSPRDRERVQFVTSNLIDALSPNNIAPLNPLFWQAIIDTGGKSIVHGVRNFARDMSSAPRVPAMVDVEAFQIGHNIAATQGSVILRAEEFELIQYTPQTAKVSRTPLLIVPPVINKYYLVDLSPDRSLVEYLVAQGQQVFTISWRNPDARHRDWGFDEYATAIKKAIDTTLAISDAPSTHMMSLCSGGALSAMLSSHLIATGEGDKIASFGLGVSVLDQSGDSTVNSLADEKSSKSAVRSSSAKGYLDGSALAEVFAWLRPNDLIWNYWVNNYLQGKKPAAFDILYWNADATRMTAKLHADFIDMFTANKLVGQGAASVLGSPVDLSTLKADSYIVAGISDHICPWQSCYRSTQLFGGDVRFVLSRSGHVACMVNPPGNKKASYRVSGSNPDDPGEWLASATTKQGSWWEDYAKWLAERSDGQKGAPSELGNDDFPVVDAAPGTYVFDR